MRTSSASARTMSIPRPDSANGWCGPALLSKHRPASCTTTTGLVPSRSTSAQNRPRECRTAFASSSPMTISASSSASRSLTRSSRYCAIERRIAAASVRCWDVAVQHTQLMYPVRRQRKCYVRDGTQSPTASSMVVQISTTMSSPVISNRRRRRWSGTTTIVARRPAASRSFASPAIAPSRQAPK